MPIATGESPQAMRLHPDDDVAIALADLPAGAAPAAVGALTSAPVPRGHKVAIRAVEPGAPVRRYGQVIGVATAPIAPGEHVHTHNLGMGGGPREHRFGTDLRPPPAPVAPRTFTGFHRGDGRTGTRNYLGVVTSVNCSGSVARFIAEEVERQGWLAQHPTIDGVVPIVHGSGCGMAGQGEGFEALERTLKGYIGHPNFGAVLLMGLGCEVMQIPGLVGAGRLRDSIAVPLHDDPGIGRHPRHRGARRGDPARAGRGGGSRPSDGAAGGGARGGPAMRRLGRLLGHHGQPGAGRGVGPPGGSWRHHDPVRDLRDLRRRAPADRPRRDSEEVGRALLDRIAWWEDYVARMGGEMDNNPSPGNKRGGLTTILEKSLGAVAKGGTAPLAGVYRFAEPIAARGFTFMDSPGYDPCSVTGQIASGATLIAFTTGRGSVSGFKPAPCLKLATNSEMFARMEGDMDVDCGDVVTRRGEPRDQGRGHLRRDARRGLGRAHEVGAPGLRRRRVRPLADGRRDVGVGPGPERTAPVLCIGRECSLGDPRPRVKDRSSRAGHRGRGMPPGPPAAASRPIGCGDARPIRIEPTPRRPGPEPGRFLRRAPGGTFRDRRGLRWRPAGRSIGTGRVVRAKASMLASRHGRRAARGGIEACGSRRRREGMVPEA